MVNCWPFDEAVSADTVKSLLPPIVVKRFTWWLDELECLSSETAEKLTICEKTTNKVSERGETSSRNAGGDSEGDEEAAKAVKLKSMKGKMRATKKRSILEIFAVAPPVKRAISGEEEEAEDDDNLGINRASKRKRRKKKKMLLRKALRAVKKIKRRKAAAAEKRGYEIQDKVCGDLYTKFNCIYVVE